MPGQDAPIIGNDGTPLVQLHFPVDHIAENPFTVPDADCDEIRPAGVFLASSSLLYLFIATSDSMPSGTKVIALIVLRLKPIRYLAILLAAMSALFDLVRR